jgi:hypothetical protein
MPYMPTSFSLLDLMNRANQGNGPDIVIPATTIAAWARGDAPAYTTEEWTPIDMSGADLVFQQSRGIMVRFGALVWASFEVQYPATADASDVNIGGLPVDAPDQTFGGGMVTFTDSPSEVPVTLLMNPGTPSFAVFSINGSPVPNSTFSGNLLYGFVIYNNDNV